MRKILIILLALATLGVVVAYQQQITTTVLRLFGVEEEKKPVIKGIASLSEASKNVTIKRAASTVWSTAETNEQLAIMDSVSTGFDSTATVKFNIGYLMNIGERSLVVIEDPKQEAANLIEVSFDQGTLQAKRIQTTPEPATDTTTTATANGNNVNPATAGSELPQTMLRIKSNNTVTEVKGDTDLSMSVDKVSKKAEIWIKIGEAKVRDDKGTEVIIKQNEKKIISTEAIEPEPKPEEESLAPPPTPEPEKIVPKKVKPKRPEKRLSRNEVIRAVARQRKKIDTCYERNRKNGIGKSLAVKLTIKNTGVVTAVTIVRSNLDDPTVERCVTFWMKAIKLPNFEGKPTEETINFAFQ